MLNHTTTTVMGDLVRFDFVPVAPTGRPLPQAPEVYIIIDASANGVVVEMHDWCWQREQQLIAFKILNRDAEGVLMLRSVSPDSAPGRKRLWGDIARNAPHDCNRLQPGQAQEAELYTPEGVWTGASALVCPWCRGLVQAGD